MIFFTSDLHLGHKNISRLCGRPFESVEEMDEILIDNWNKKIHRCDTVYILGDIMELEANTFAAEFLLDDVTLFEAIAEQLNFFQTASLLRVPPELLDFKLRLLRREGHSVNPLYIAQSDFLKRNIGRPKN